jgi:hypothetical protein
MSFELWEETMNTYISHVLGRSLAVGATAGFALTLVLLLAARPVTAQQVPFAGKQIEIVVPFAPGGATDVGARFLAPFLEKHLPGKPRVNVVNRAGGGSILGANWFAQNAKPDGLIFLFTTSSTSHPFLFGQKEVAYDLLKTRIGFSQSTVRHWLRTFELRTVRARGPHDEGTSARELVRERLGHLQLRCLTEHDTLRLGLQEAHLRTIQLWHVLDGEAVATGSAFEPVVEVGGAACGLAGGVH